jgi:hypothetical protein
MGQRTDPGRLEEGADLCHVRREGWPLPTFETEANGDFYERGPFFADS